MTDSPLHFPDQMTVLEARDRYLALNGFDVAGYTASTFSLKVLGRPVTMRNSDSRKRAIPLHDIHHAVTGFGTDFTGEAEIGAYELMAGCRSFITYYLNGMAFTLGLVIAPVRVFKALLRSRKAFTLYAKPIPYERLLTMTVGEVRQHLGIPRAGLADHPPGLHVDAPRTGANRSAHG